MGGPAKTAISVFVLYLLISISGAMFAQTSGYESEPSSALGIHGDLSSTVSDGSSLLSSAGGSGSEVATLAGGSEGGVGSATDQQGLRNLKEEDWVAVQRKKKSSHGELKVSGLKVVICFICME